MTRCGGEMRRALARVALGMILSLASAAAPSLAADVGFAKVAVPYGTEPPLEVGVWYPTRSRAAKGPRLSLDQTLSPGALPIASGHHPLIALSHGGGGSFESHADTAIALARAGFVAVAVSHRGDTYDDQSQVLKLWRRPGQLHRVITYMLGTSPWRSHLDAGKVGAFGFSNGGFTVLVAAGGAPDLGRTAAYCEANPTHDLCQALGKAGISAQDAFAVPGAWIRDPRVKAIVVVAPAFGFAFDRQGLARVRVPVQLWGAAADRHQPPPLFEDVVRSALPEQPEFHRVQNAGHYDFLPPCDAHLAAANPTICTSLPGFDRAAFHTKFNAEVVQFFGKALQWPLDAASTYSSPLRATVRAGSLSCKVGSKRSPLMSAKRHKRTSARFPKADI